MYMRRKLASGHRRRRIKWRSWPKHAQTVRRGQSGGARRSLLRPPPPDPPVRGEGEGGDELPRALEFGGLLTGGTLPRTTPGPDADGPHGGDPPAQSDVGPQGAREASPGPDADGPHAVWGDRPAQSDVGPQRA